jgi:glycosyltransferase involved in cell wall biosynthesis
MKILHLNTHASGGSYEYAALLCTALARQGIESHLLSKNSQPPEARRLFLDRVIRRLYVSLSTQPWHGTRRLLTPPAGEQLDGIDVVHLHTVADWFDVPHWMETLPRRMGVVISVHDMWHISGGCFLYRGCDRYRDTCTPCPILKPPLNRVLAKDEHRRKLQAYQSRGIQFVANSQWLANLAERSPLVRAFGDLRVITPGIDTDIFRPREKAQCRASLGIQQSAFVIAAGAASLADANKNIRWLLEQLTRLPELQDLVVLLAGEGAVDVPAGLDVRMIGGIADRAARAIFYGTADIFVSASLMETYGLTLVEAMACGIPVVGFRVGGIPEAAPDGQGAILCEPQDAAALLEAIAQLRESPHLRETLGRLGQETAHSRNAVTSFASKFAQLYRESVGLERTSRAHTPATVT